MSGVQVEDISAGHLHFPADAGRGLGMGKGQIFDEFAAQIVDLGDADMHVAHFQFSLHFFKSAEAPEQGLADKDQDVIGHVASSRHQLEQ
ncbi:hypothetical protein [Desulfonatronum thioautotrophicum]|uniref:hypothetical protein n=1 Tax=Desulfonatronum thioautotrophicum TaxID=617001 RepID=UPI0012947ED7|nr:hypothetical protein [Desulfonatronum thioautotrophicum]